MDLADWYDAGRYTALLDLINQLPTACRLNEAMVNDPATAKLLAEKDLETDPREKDPWAPKVSEYSLVPLMLREILGALDALRQAVTASGGQRPHPGKPFPAPRTEIEKAKQELEREFTVDIVGMFGFSESDL